MYYTRPVSFRDFLGNSVTVTRLRKSVRTGHFPQALVLAGPKGAGKYTLSLMLAQAVNCLNPTESDGLPDYCGQCHNCERIGAAANLEERVAEPVAAREDMRDADKRETRILIQTHPDVLIVPPDPPQLLIKLGQVRQVIHVAYYRPPGRSWPRGCGWFWRLSFSTLSAKGADPTQKHHKTTQTPHPLLYFFFFS